MDFFLTILGGVAIGVCGSIGAWLITFRAIKPGLNVSEHISRVSAPEDYPVPHVYRMKVTNRRRRRQAIDVTVQCKLRLEGVFTDRLGNAGLYDLAVESNLARIKPAGSHTFWLKLLSNADVPKRLPLELRARFDNGTIRLEEVLALPGAQLQFYVRCADGFSGAPLLKEKTYTAGVVRIGDFETKSCAVATGALAEVDELSSERTPAP